MQVITWEKILKTFLSVKCGDAVLNTTLVIVIWEIYEKLSSLMVNIYQERNITLIYSFFRHGKHLRQLTTWSRLGPTDSSAKNFTVPRIWVKLCWMTDEHTSSKLEITLISRRRGIGRLLYQKVVVFDRWVSHNCQFRRRNDIDSCWTLLINYK